MRDVATQPETKRFGFWDPEPKWAIGGYLARMALDDPQGVPLVATYALQHKPCNRFADSLSDVNRYKAWIDSFASGIWQRRAVVFLEIDGLISTHCLNRAGKLRRYAELRYGMARLTALPHTVVYLDAGSADAHPARTTAREFVRSGGMLGQGFFLNSTHYNWTRSEVRYGQQIVSLLPTTRRFVVSTAVNGRGPVVPKNRVRDGNEVRCNPPGRGLGPRATS
jgi:endoglucanase